jgi:hypothetical protein
VEQWTPDGDDSSLRLSPTRELNETEFWDDVDASLGTLWFEGAESLTGVPAHQGRRNGLMPTIFFNRLNGRGVSSGMLWRSTLNYCCGGAGVVVVVVVSFCTCSGAGVAVVVFVSDCFTLWCLYLVVVSVV